jgi:hypothetical protein
MTTVADSAVIQLLNMSVERAVLRGHYRDGGGPNGVCAQGDVADHNGYCED